jgi:hypothetical protein
MGAIIAGTLVEAEANMIPIIMTAQEEPPRLQPYHMINHLFLHLATQQPMQPVIRVARAAIERMYDTTILIQVR